MPSRTPKGLMNELLTGKGNVSTTKEFQRGMKGEKPKGKYHKIHI